MVAWIRPAGRPASRRVIAIIKPVMPALVDGLKTTALPAASAADSLRIGIVNGKFQGVMRATTPSGSMRVNMSSSTSVENVVPSFR